MSKKVFAGLGIAAALGVAVLPAVGTYAETTYIKATVDQFVGCTSSNNTAATALDLGHIAAGQQKSATFSIAGATNDPKGFTLTGTPSALAHTNGTDSISYSASGVSAGTAAWFLSTVTGYTDGITIGSTAVLNSRNLATPRENSWNISATVSTATTTTTGEYNGTIEWTCVVNN